MHLGLETHLRTFFQRDIPGQKKRKWKMKGKNFFTSFRSHLRMGDTDNSQNFDRYLHIAIRRDHFYDVPYYVKLHRC
ncbi:hypothetical protein CEXT_779251 [Caerostris extrusa]|uniref:Uncharacterized protein n=1 Tax=Caerostris extrusa TaxID=172846 RepID=A0AAV4X2R7_CAEEX|nr:hypothetical protein CEXT_779251 [Caerostris extrusa]